MRPGPFLLSSPSLRDPRLHARLLILFTLVAYYVVGYFALNIYNETRSYYVDISTRLDGYIPFVAAASWPYGLVFPSIVFGFHSIPLERVSLFRRGAYLMAANITIAFVVFLAMPVRAVRPELIGDGSVHELMAAFWFFVDKPTNLFPSLHVNLSMVAGLVGLTHSRVAGALGLGCAVAVAFSAVLLKQHYLADIAAGALLAMATYWWAFVRVRAPFAAELQAPFRDAPAFARKNPTTEHAR